MKIGAIIPIRLASERLPKKAILPIVEKPAVEHVIDRALASNYIKNKKDVVVCTTLEKEDDELVELVESYGASVFRGSTDDLINRLWCAIEEHSFDIVIEIDGDDICADPFYMDVCVGELLKDDSLDVVLPKNLPLGLATKALRRSAFEKILLIYKTKKNDTGFMYYFTKSGYCTIKEVEADSSHIFEEARLTLDYEEDLNFFRAIFEELYVEGKIFDINDIIELLKRKPQILKLNDGLNEKYWARTKEKTKIEFEAKDKSIKKIEL